MRSEIPHELHLSLSIFAQMLDLSVRASTHRARERETRASGQAGAAAIGNRRAHTRSYRIRFGGVISCHSTTFSTLRGLSNESLRQEHRSNHREASMHIDQKT